MEKLLRLFLSIGIEDANPAIDLLEATSSGCGDENGIDALQPLHLIRRRVAFDLRENLGQLCCHIRSVGVAELIQVQTLALKRIGVNDRQQLVDATEL